MQNNREKFVSILTSLEAQWNYDTQYNETLIKLHGENSNPEYYHNDLLYKELINVLVGMVPMEDQKANMEICRYMYELEFGKHENSDIKDHNNLYDLLTIEKLVEDAKKHLEEKVTPIDLIVSKVLNFQTSRIAGLDKQVDATCIEKFKEKLEEKFNVTYKE